MHDQFHSTQRQSALLGSKYLNIIAIFYFFEHTEINAKINKFDKKNGKIDDLFADMKVIKDYLVNTNYALTTFDKQLYKEVLASFLNPGRGAEMACIPENCPAPLSSAHPHSCLSVQANHTPSLLKQIEKLEKLLYQLKNMIQPRQKFKFSRREAKDSLKAKSAESSQKNEK